MTEEEIIVAAKKIVTDVLGPLYTIRLIGSRANGTAHARSDFDFLVSGPESIPILKLAELYNRAEQLPTLFSVDFVDEHSASQEFLATIN